MLPEHLRPIRCNAALPVGDNGIWRERGVTHWHLLRRDWGRNDRDRFLDERARSERFRPSHGVAWNPQEVADWLVDEAFRAAQECPSPEAMLRSSGMDTPEGVRTKHESRFHGAMFGRDVCAMMGLGDLRIADLAAYAMTAEMCRDHRR